MKTASGFITHITLLALAASALLSCTGNRGAEVRLQRAEDIMNERGGRLPSFFIWARHYTSFSSLYKDSSEVRRKLGMAENDTNLSIFLQELLKMKIVK